MLTFCLLYWFFKHLKLFYYQHPARKVPSYFVCLIRVKKMRNQITTATYIHNFYPPLSNNVISSSQWSCSHSCDWISILFHPEFFFTEWFIIVNIVLGCQHRADDSIGIVSILLDAISSHQQTIKYIVWSLSDRWVKWNLRQNWAEPLLNIT